MDGRHGRARALRAGVVVALAAMAAPGAARAQFARRIHGEIEGGAAVLLGEYRGPAALDATGNVVDGPTTSGGFGFRGALSLGVDLVDVLALDLQAGLMGMPSELQRYSPAWTFGLGLAVQPRVGTVGRFVISAHAGLGYVPGGTNGQGTQTDPATPFMFDVGAAFLFHIGSVASLGPSLRYVHILQPDVQTLPHESNFLGAANALTFGLTVRFGGGRRDEGPTRAAAVSDLDDDGVPDESDRCPDRPQGDNPDAARPGCPAAETDSDGDGVSDNRDQCPQQARGDDPDLNRLGCPAPDSDGDGVSDARDQCPRDAQGANPDPVRAGCPASSGAAEFPSVSVSFDRRSTRVEGAATAALDQVVTFLNAHPEVELIAVEAHVAEHRARRRNQQFSEERAQAIQSYITQHGVTGNRVMAVGYGNRCVSEGSRVDIRVARVNGQMAPNVTFGCPAAASMVPAALRGESAPVQNLTNGGDSAEEEPSSGRRHGRHRRGGRHRSGGSRHHRRRH